MAQTITEPIYPEISDLGDVVSLFSSPLFPRPPVRIPMTHSRLFEFHPEDKAYTLFLDTLEFDLRRFGQVLRGEIVDSDFDILPAMIDLSTPGSEAINLYIRWSAIHFNLILDRSARMTMWWFLPYTWDGCKFNVRELKSDFLKPLLPFVWTDEFLDDNLPPTSNDFEAQFGIPVNHTVQLDNGLMELLQQALGDLKVATENKQSVLSMGCKIFTILASRDNPLIVAATLTDFFLSLNVTGRIVARAVDFIMANCISPWRGQAGLQDNLRPIAMMMTCICTVAGTSMLPGQKLIDKILFRMSSLGKACSGYNSITEQFQELFDYIYKTCYTFMYGVPPGETELDVFLNDLEQWYVDVGEYLTLDTQDKIPIDFETCRKIEELYKKGLEFSERISKFKISNILRQPFTTHWIAMTKLYDKVIGQGARMSEPRTEPVCIHLYGDSGVGKSGLTFLVAQDLCNVENLAHRSHDEVYFRNVEQEFWDNYHGQLVTVYDDFGQLRDTTNNRNPEFMELIRSQNIAPWPLHMAHLDEKARTRFVSRACILTSNKRFYVMESLTCSDAFRRRIDVQAKVQVKPEYLVPHTKQIDQSKVKYALDEDIYEFIMQDPHNKNELNTKPIPYSEFSKIIVNKYKQCYKRSVDRIACLQERAIRISRNNAIPNNLDLEAQVADRDLVIQIDQALYPTIWAKLNDDNYDDAQVRQYLPVKIYNDLIEVAKSVTTYEEFVVSADVYCVTNRVDLINEICVTQDYMNMLNEIVSEPTFTTARFRQVVNEVQEYFKKKFRSFRNTVVTFWRSLLSNTWHTLLLSGLGIASIAMSFYFTSYYNKSVNAKIDEGIEAAKSLDKDSWSHKLNRFFGIVSDEDLSTAVEQVPLVDETRELEQRPRQVFRTETKELEQRPRPVFRTENLTCETVELERLPVRKFVSEAKQLEDDDFQSVTSDWDVPVLPEAQASADQNAQEITSKVKLNTYVLFTYDPEKKEWLRMNNVLFVKGRIGLTIAHCIPFLKEQCKLIGLSRSTYGIQFSLSQCKFQRLTTSSNLPVDAVAIEFPNNVVQHANLLPHFQTVEDIQSFNVVKACLLSMKCIPFQGNLMACPDLLQLPRVQAQEELKYEIKGSKQNDYMLRHGYTYRAETTNGDCGAILVAFNPKLVRKILGIHVAGSKRGTNEGLGAAQMVTQGMLERAFEAFTFEGQISFNSIEDTTFNSDIPTLEGDFLPIGLLSRIPPSAVRTSLRPSKLYDKIISPKTKPARLTPFINEDGEEINPKLKGIKKNGITPLPIDPILIERVKQAVQSSLGVSDVERRVYSLSEAIQGLEDDEYIRPINRKTSPGYPWIFKKQGKRGKTRWLGNDQNYIVDDPDLKKRIEERIECAKRGIRLPALWIDTLKDERRPIEKVNQGKTRVFNAGPMDYIIVFRQYFLAFIAHMMKAKIFNESNVGINPYSSDWHMLARYLREVGDCMFAGDFSNFDGSLHPQILWAILDIVNDWYRAGASDDTLEEVEEDCRIRSVLFSCIVNAVHVVVMEHKGVKVAYVYCCTHAQPSGNAFTTVLNTLYNKFGFRIVFVLVTNLDLSKFARNVRCAFFGDDSVLSVHPSLIDQFNQVTIADAFKTIGMTYTDEQKSGNLIYSTSLENLSFLKRGFKMDDLLCRYVGPLDLDVVLEMPMWVKTDYDDSTRCSTTVEQCYGELAIHGREIFNEWATKIDKLCHRYLDYPPPLFHYIDYKDRDLRRY